MSCKISLLFFLTQLICELYAITTFRDFQFQIGFKLIFITLFFDNDHLIFNCIYYHSHDPTPLLVLAILAHTRINCLVFLSIYFALFPFHFIPYTRCVQTIIFCYTFLFHPYKVSSFHVIPPLESLKPKHGFFSPIVPAIYTQYSIKHNFMLTIDLTRHPFGQF